MFGAFLLLACNRIFVVSYFGVRAARQIVGQSSLCAASVGSAAGSSILYCWPLHAFVKDTVKLTHKKNDIAS